MDKYVWVDSIGRRIREEPWPELGRSLIEKIKEAVVQDRPDEALDMLAYLNERGHARRGVTVFPFRVLWWWMNPGYIAAKSGEDSIEGVMRCTLTPWFRQFYDRIKDVPVMEKLQLAAEIKRSERSGPGGMGDISFIEEDDRYVLIMNPCGIAGRSRKRPVPERFPNAAQGDNIGSCRKAHSWTWSMTGVNYRCIRCCVLNEILPIEWDGYPL